MLRLHRAGARVTIPVVANGSFESSTPLYTHTEWRDGVPPLWTFEPGRGLLYQRSSPTEYGWEQYELAAIAMVEGGMQ
jgi:hypothetical protein